jgi:hypothetical protein
MTVTSTSAPDPYEEFSAAEGAMWQHVSPEKLSGILARCPRQDEHKWPAVLVTTFMQSYGKVAQQEGMEAQRENLRRKLGVSYSELKASPERKMIAVPASSPPPLVDDAVGYDDKPDPLTFTTEEEFIAGLRAFTQWAGDFTSRQLANWSGNVVSHMTIYNLLAKNARKRPPLKLAYVQAIIRGCGGSQDDIARWTTAWRRIRRGAGTSSGTGENNVISLNKRAANSG